MLILSSLIKTKKTKLISQRFKYYIFLRCMQNNVEGQEQLPPLNLQEVIIQNPIPQSPATIVNPAPVAAPEKYNVITEWLKELMNKYSDYKAREQQEAELKKIEQQSNDTYAAAFRSPEIIIPKEGSPLSKEAQNLSEIVAVSVASLQAVAHKVNISIENCKVLGTQCKGVIKSYDEVITSAKSWRSFFKVTGFITALVLIAVKIGLAGKLPDIAMGVGSVIMNNLPSSESKELLKDGIKNLPAPVLSGSVMSEFILQHPLTFIGGVGFTLGATAAIKFGLIVLKTARR